MKLYKANLKFIFGVVLFFNVACDQKNVVEKDFPQITTSSVSQINSEGATFNADILSLNNASENECGFLWSTNESFEYDNSERIYRLNIDEVGMFSLDVIANLKEGLQYFVKAYIKTESIIVYGNVVKFVSLGSGAPIVSSFKPQSGKVLDEVVINGSNFSSVLENNVVKFNDIEAKVIDSQIDKLTVLVPLSLKDSINNISVSIFGNASFLTEKFKFLPMRIDSADPILGTFNQTISINGENLPVKNEYFNILFDSTNAEIINLTDKSLNVLYLPILKRKQVCCIFSLKDFEKS